MAYRVDLTPRAERDLADLYGSIHAEDSPQAARWFNGLERLIYLLETIPALGFVTHESPVHSPTHLWQEASFLSCAL